MHTLLPNKVKKRLSVIIPVYNHAHYLPEGLKSIISQIEQQDELILVDDGSIDPSPLIVRQYAQRYPNLIRYLLKKNEGLTRTLNIGLSMASGEFVLFIASDDKLWPDVLQKALATMQPDVDFVIHGARYFGDPKYENKLVYSGVIDELLHESAHDILTALYVTPPSPLLVQSTIFRKSFLTELGGFDETLAIDDWPLFIRSFRFLLASKRNWKYDSTIILTGYRIHGSNQSKNILRHYSACVKVINSLCSPEFKNTALGRLAINHGLNLLRKGKPSGIGILLQGARKVSLQDIVIILKTRILRRARRLIYP